MTRAPALAVAVLLLALPEVSGTSAPEASGTSGERLPEASGTPVSEASGTSGERPSEASGTPVSEASGTSGEGCWLGDGTAGAGVDFVHDRGTTPEKHLPETMGAGVAWLDYDGDGWSDLYLVQSGPFPPDGSPAPGRLYRNLGDGTFADVTAEAGLSGVPGYGQGATAADADGDGDPDLYLAAFGRDTFWENLGDGTFADATAAAGLGAGGWSSSAAFADADADGDLDLYVTRYVLYDPAAPLFCGDVDSGERVYCDPSLFAGEADLFYRNTGDGTFVDATAAAGLSDARGRGLGVVFTDLDGDRDPDLYVANDLTLNLLYENLGDGTFADLSLLSGAAVNREGKPEAGMGLVAADVDGDGDPDLAVTNFDVETNTLYRNLGGLAFDDVSAASGFGVPSFNLLGFGLAAADFDGDGSLDVYAANGHIFERPKRSEIGYAQRDLLLLGDGAGGFAESVCPALAADPRVGRGLAAADLDRDGDPDLAINNNGGAAQLLFGTGRPGEGDGGNGWLGVRFAAGRPMVGARLELLHASGRRQTRWLLAGESYQSSHEPAALFRFPPDDPPRLLEAEWPDGDRLRLPVPPVGRYLELPAG